MSVNDMFNDNQMAATLPIDSIPTHGSQKLMVVIFVIDCSRSMDDFGRIQAVNAALNELRFRLSDIQSRDNLDLKIAIMGFTSSARWELELTPIDEVIINNISTHPGLTEYGTAFRELNKVLCKDGFMKHIGKKAAPVIIFLTDGEPTDDYSADLDELMKNGWFRCANRSAILMGDAFNNVNAKNAVEKFVTNPLTDVVSADDTTMVTEKITAATVHTVAGNPQKDDKTNSHLNTTNQQLGPFGNADSTDTSTTNMPQDVDFPYDPDVGGYFMPPDDLINDDNNVTSGLDASINQNDLPFSNDAFDSIFPDDPSFSDDASGLATNDFGDTNDFS